MRARAAAGSVASLWQQAGRAGRREQPSLSIYIGFDGPLDQFFMHQPENLFTRPIETAQVCSAGCPDLAETAELTAVSQLTWTHMRSGPEAACGSAD